MWPQAFPQAIECAPDEGRRESGAVSAEPLEDGDAVGSADQKESRAAGIDIANAPGVALLREERHQFLR